MITVSHLKQHAKVTLSQQELRAISDQINQDFAPNIAFKALQPASTTRLSSKELRDISAEISREFAPAHSTEVAELVLLPIDPTHLYAYWQLTDTQMTRLSENTAEDKTPVTLRIYSKPSESLELNPHNVWFDVAIHAEQSHQAVQLPDAIATSNAAIFYTGVIGERDAEDHMTPFAQSNTLHYAGDNPNRQTQKTNKTGLSSVQYLFNQTPSPIISVTSL
ncbi:MAG: DUF4912 domain-containing protein [Methylococcales bacterium]